MATSEFMATKAAPQGSCPKGLFNLKQEQLTQENKDRGIPTADKNDSEMRIDRLMYEMGLQEERRDDARTKLLPVIKLNKEQFIEYLATLGSDKDLLADIARLEAQTYKAPVMTKIMEVFKDATSSTFASFQIYGQKAATDNNDGLATNFWDSLSSDSRLVVLRRQYKGQGVDVPDSTSEAKLHEMWRSLSAQDKMNCVSSFLPKDSGARKPSRIPQASSRSGKITGKGNSLLPRRSGTATSRKPHQVEGKQEPGMLEGLLASRKSGRGSKRDGKGEGKGEGKGKRKDDEDYEDDDDDEEDDVDHENEKEDEDEDEDKKEDEDEDEDEMEDEDEDDKSSGTINHQAMVDRARRALSTLAEEAPPTKRSFSNIITARARLALISKHLDALEHERLLVNHDADRLVVWAARRERASHLAVLVGRKISLDEDGDGAEDVRDMEEARDELREIAQDLSDKAVEALQEYASAVLFVLDADKEY